MCDSRVNRRYPLTRQFYVEQRRLDADRYGVVEIPAALQDQYVHIQDPALLPLYYAQRLETKCNVRTIGA